MPTDEKKYNYEDENKDCSFCKKISNLNKRLTKSAKETILFCVKLSKDNDFKEKAQILFFTGVFSYLGTCILENNYLTGIYIFLTVIFSLLAVTLKHIEKGPFILRSFNKYALFRWLFFTFFAILPALIHAVTVLQTRGERWTLEYTGNLSANIFGAFTTCSIYNLVLRLDMKQLQKNFKMTFFSESSLQLSLNAALLNAVNYMKDEWNAANIANAIHLFLVVSIGFYNAAILLRYITDDEPLGLPPTKIYPKAAFTWGLFFLMSYGIFIVFPFEKLSSEWVLFLFDCGTFLIAVWYVFYCIFRHTKDDCDEYPWIAVIIFTFAGLAISGIVLLSALFCHIEANNLEKQIKSGLSILLGVICIICLIKYLTVKRSHK